MGRNSYDDTRFNDLVDLRKCTHCGTWHQGTCPRIKSIEYYENGGIKRVEYKDEQNPLQDYQTKTNE